MNEDSGLEIAPQGTIKRRALESGCRMWAPIFPPIAASEAGLPSEGPKESKPSAASAAAAASE